MKTVAGLLALTLASCASAKIHTSPLEWSSLGTGCHARGLADVLLVPDEFETKIGFTDIRIGRLPDTGRGPGLLAHFRRRLDGPWGQRTAQPQLFLAVGDWKRSCSVLVEQEACPEATEIYSMLATRSIPIGFSFDHIRPITVMHGTMHFLSATDGQGNQTDWSFYGVDHPLQDAVSSALDRLEACAQPAASAFNETRLETVP